MIEIKNLTKIFKSKHKETTTALDDVSFNLPDTGFVFITGKSGSGKTTLLNMIAAVDSYNKGEIIVDGLSLNNLKGSEFDYYRNQNIGFIFQDYQLLDDLTVFENVRISLKFQNDNDDIKVHEALESVGLKDFENRFPRELSGGEKQRVAIARAIVKNPKIILADEPTGNLDTNTSKEILNILKEISKNKLVLIVSHNIFDAKEYASYIYELSYGKLIGTYKRNEFKSKSIELKDGVLRLPIDKDLNEIETEEVLKNINKGVNELVQNDNDFEPSKIEKNGEIETKTLQKKHISFNNAFKLGIAFLRKSLSTILFFSSIVASIFGIIYSSEIILDTQISDSLKANRENYSRDLITLNDKWIQNTDRSAGLEYNFTNKEDLKAIVDQGYNGKIYPGYNLFNTSLFDTPLCTIPASIKVVDEDYFKNYVDELEFHYVADTYKKEGIYITDYVIDMFGYKFPHAKFGYQDVKSICDNFSIPYLNGVINTHYNDKYPEMIEINKKIFESVDLKQNSFNDLDEKRIDDFAYDLNFYTNAYTFEKDYLEILRTLEEYIISIIRPIFCYYEGEECASGFKSISFSDIDFNAIGRDLYKKITGKEVPVINDFEKLEQPITLSFNFNNSKFKNDKSSQIDITFEYIYSDPLLSYSSFALPKTNLELYETFTPLKEITFENTDKLQNILKNGSFYNLILLNYSYFTLAAGTPLYSIFDKIFKLVIILLFFATIIALVFYSAYIVKKNVRNIGILKSLGARSRDILIALSLNIILTSIVSAVFNIGFSYLFLFIIDKILINSFKEATGLFNNAYHIKYLLNNELLMTINSLFVITLLLVSSILIFIRLNKYKPTELIKGAK